MSRTIHSFLSCFRLSKALIWSPMLRKSVVSGTLNILAVVRVETDSSPPDQ